MPHLSNKRVTRLFLMLSLTALTLPSSGCLAAAVTAGVVGAGAAGYAYYQGGVPRDFPTGMDQTWAATQLALADLGMPVLSGERDNDGATIESRTGDGDKIIISIEPRASRVPADGQWTHVTVRVALLGDAPVSERLFKQIEARLGLPSRPSPSPGQPGPTPNGPPPWNATAQPDIIPAGQSGIFIPVVNAPAQTVQPPMKESK